MAVQHTTPENQTQRGVEGTRGIAMELSITADRCLPFQGQVQGTTAQCVSNNQPAPALPTAALKLGLGGFKKVGRTEENGPCPFPGLQPGVLEMRVKEGSKIRNLMGFAMARMQGAGSVGGQAGQRRVVFTGSGRAVTKTITCAEIMKRKVGGLHQLTKLQYKGVREVWESHEGGESEMTVHRTVPSISILLSKDPLDPQEPGYQPPESHSVLWEERERAEPPQVTRKRPLEPTGSPSRPQSKRPYLQGGSSLAALLTDEQAEHTQSVKTIKALPGRDGTLLSE